jgi:hypothetical protein
LARPTVDGCDNLTHAGNPSPRRKDLQIGQGGTPFDGFAHQTHEDSLYNCFNAGDLGQAAQSGQR